jgi:hypothetical protein
MSTEKSAQDAKLIMAINTDNWNYIFTNAEAANLQMLKLFANQSVGCGNAAPFLSSSSPPCRAGHVPHHTSDQDSPSAGAV